MDNLFEIVPLESVDIDINVLKTYVNNYMKHRLEYYTERNCNLRLESDFTEWWIEKSSKGIHVGNGKYPIDVITASFQGIDVMNVCLNGKYTNEKSIIQIFIGDSLNLDTLFENKKYENITDFFKRSLIKKFTKTCTDNEIEDIFYVAFISTKYSINMAVLRINLDNIVKIKTGIPSKNGKSIPIINVITPECGKAIIYRSKKRMELRLSSNIINHEHSVELFKLSPPN